MSLNINELKQRCKKASLQNAVRDSNKLLLLNSTCYIVIEFLVSGMPVYFLGENDYIFTSVKDDNN